MAKTHKLDIFRTLKHIDEKDVDYYSSLEEEEQKAYFPLVIARWLSGTRDARQIVFLNELVNRFVFAIPNHKDLLHKLMCLCTTGKPRRYFWNKVASGKTTSKPNAVSVIREYFGYNTKQAKDALQLLTVEDVIEYAEQLGRQKDEITKIKKEL